MHGLCHLKALQLAVEKYITKPQQSGQAPSRCYISLNLKNMFNEISREKILQVIQAKFPEMLPLVSLLYSDPGTVFFPMADGTWHTQSMAEGVNQGCPLSSILAALVLHEVLAPIDAKLKLRAVNHLRLQNKGDDETGGVKHIIPWRTSMTLELPSPTKMSNSSLMSSPSEDPGLVATSTPSRQ